MQLEEGGGRIIFGARRGYSVRGACGRVRKASWYHSLAWFVARYSRQQMVKKDESENYPGECLGGMVERDGDGRFRRDSQCRASSELQIITSFRATCEGLTWERMRPYVLG